MSRAVVAPLQRGSGPAAGSQTVRRNVSLGGVVQGVGMRPAIWRLASELGLAGWIRNTPSGVEIEIEGPAPACAELERRALSLPPPVAPRLIDRRSVPLRGEPTFAIATSECEGEPRLHVAPDIAICAECLVEVRSPGGRRAGHPFASCAACGPRYTLLLALPYDRERTTMRGLALCARCSEELHDPSDRRYHAQTQSCPDCGPKLALTDRRGCVLGRESEALERAVRALEEGQIVALQGVGGFQLLVRARDERAVARLRARKSRPHKPLALLYGTLDSVRADCDVGPREAELLESPAGPIVLLSRGACGSVPDIVAPRCPELGVMLPTTALHALLVDASEGPLVATSGNRSGEPLCIDEHEARARLGDVADLFLVHDRPIARPCDDSVARVVCDRTTLLRRARGYAPSSLPLAIRPPRAVMGLGAHLKSTLAFSHGAAISLGPHVGDLQDVRTVTAFERALSEAQELLGARPQVVAHDLHPDYWTTRRALRMRSPDVEVRAVQHHVAHAAALRLEHGIESAMLAATWDGSGLGPDETLWGGELLRVEAGGRWQRLAHLRTFPLPGGEAAAREPRRSALGLLFEAFGPEVFEWDALPPLVDLPRETRTLLRGALIRGVQSPRTSSVGRLFDAVASLLGLCQRASYEGQAASWVEWEARGVTASAYPFAWQRVENGPAIVDWRPMLERLLDDLRDGRPSGEIAAAFHAMLVDVLTRSATELSLPCVGLSGGCFQSRLLLSQAVSALEVAGHVVYWHQEVPSNDGALALGQVAWVAEELAGDVPGGAG